MLRRHLIAREAQGERDFRWRGGEVSRIEGLTDGVFALAIALLVISMEVPRTFPELVEAFVQAPVFLVCFAVLFLAWHGHFQFYRRYGLEDPLTLLLNAALIFLVALYVYPLKFLFSVLWNGLVLGRGLAVRDLRGEVVVGEGGEPLLALRPAEGEMADLMVLYGLGSAALFGVFLLMTWRAWAWRERLQLDDRERLLTLAGLWSHGISMGFGVTSALLAGVSPPLAGFLYLGLGPVQVVNGLHWERRVERQLPEVTQDEIPPDIGAGAP